MIYTQSISKSLEESRAVKSKERAQPYVTETEARRLTNQEFERRRVYMEKKHLDILKNILKAYDYTFYIFGSRATGRTKPFSDIDLFYKGTIPNNILLRLEDALEESDLPYKVDVVSYDTCDAEFKKILDKNHVRIHL